jgi:hypothetical protein
MPPEGATGALRKPGAVAARGALSENLARVKTLLLVAIGLYCVGLFFNFSGLSRLNQLRQLYGLQPDTTQLWFLILVDIGLAGLSAYAVMELGKGNIKLARAATVANAILGAIATLLFFRSGIVSIALNGGLLACGIWGRMLISKEERPLV